MEHGVVEPSISLVGDLDPPRPPRPSAIASPGNQRNGGSQLIDQAPRLVRRRPAAFRFRRHASRTRERLKRHSQDQGQDPERNNGL